MNNNQKDLLIELVKTDFKLRYNNSVLGFVWVFLKPFLLFLILAVVFSRLAGTSIKNYPVYLLLGIIMFSFFQEGTLYGMNALLNKSSIILKINFPREVAVFAATLLSVINYLLNSIIFFIIALFFGVRFSPLDIVLFLAISILLYEIILTFALYASIVYVRYRDFTNIWELTSQLIFYGTPIIYPITLLPHSLQNYVYLNPLAVIILGARGLLLPQSYNNPPHVTRFIIIFVITSILFVLGYIFFKRMVKRIAEFF